MFRDNPSFGIRDVALHVIKQLKMVFKQNDFGNEITVLRWQRTFSHISIKTKFTGKTYYGLINW